MRTSKSPYPACYRLIAGSPLQQEIDLYVKDQLSSQREKKIKTIDYSKHGYFPPMRFFLALENNNMEYLNKDLDARVMFCKRKEII